jgi:hypothetical protein
LLALLISTGLYAALCRWLYQSTLRSRAWAVAIRAINGQLLEMAAYCDLPSQMLRTWVRSIRNSFKLARLLLRPSLALVLPTLLAASYWQLGWSERPIQPGEEVVLSLAAPPSGSPELSLPPEVEQITAGVFNPSDQRYYWLLRPVRAGSYLIEVSLPAQNLKSETGLVCATLSLGQTGKIINSSSLLNFWESRPQLRLHLPAAQLCLGQQNFAWWWLPTLLTMGWMSALSSLRLIWRTLPA